MLFGHHLLRKIAKIEYLKIFHKIKLILLYYNDRLFALGLEPSNTRHIIFNLRNCKKFRRIYDNLPIMDVIF